MRASNVSEFQLRQAANQTGVVLNEVRCIGRQIQFTIRPDRAIDKPKDGFPSRRYQLVRSSAFPYSRGAMGVRRDGRRNVWAVCWHGHREFFRALFAIAPEAIVRVAATGQRYTAENFEETHVPTGGQNIGSRIEPLYRSEACDCRERHLD